MQDNASGIFVYESFCKIVNNCCPEAHKHLNFFRNLKLFEIIIYAVDDFFCLFVGDNFFLLAHASLAVQRYEKSFASIA
ncbi:hypothetical protein SDC9_92654 [bioreactor metagenome]|uniref:Uncharacterized protein n=1 Tax=bioreactor metagenome TaxID=1076179 RepID=A0A644ZYA1_9ZZZZ